MPIKILNYKKTTYRRTKPNKVFTKVYLARTATAIAKGEFDRVGF